MGGIWLVFGRLGMVGEGDGVVGVLEVGGMFFIFGADLAGGMAGRVVPRLDAMKDKEIDIERLNEKDARAFETVFRTFYASLVRFAVGYVGREEEAEDVVEDVFVALWEGAARFESVEALRGFLYRATRNGCLNVLKRREVEERYAGEVRGDRGARRGAGGQGGGDGGDGGDGDGGDGGDGDGEDGEGGWNEGEGLWEDEGEAEGREMREELYRQLFEAIDELPARCREVFLMHLEGKGNEDIARELALSVLTVKTQKRRAMAYLRGRFGEATMWVAAAWGWLGC